MNSVPDDNHSDLLREDDSAAPQKPKRRHPFRYLPIFLGIAGMFWTISGVSDPGAPTADYAGMQTCISSGCHGDYRNYLFHGAEEFLLTAHGQTHYAPTPDNVIIDRWFRADTTLRYRDPRVRNAAAAGILLQLRYDEAEGYQARIETEGPAPESTDWLTVTNAIGGTGWQQRYLVEIEGSRYTLPFQYVLPGYRNHSDSGQYRVVDVDEWIAYDSVADRLRVRRTEDRTFAAASWDNACIGCHVGGFELGPESPDGSGMRRAVWPGSESGDSALSLLNMSIGCESCHGPGSLHIADPDNRDYQKALSPKTWDRAGESRIVTDRKLDLCNQCHSAHRSSDGLHPFPYDDAGDFPFLPGEDLRGFVRDPVADAHFWGDGFTSAAHHQTGQDYVRSKHYTEHVFTNGCFDCHMPHTNTDQPYMLTRDWYSLDKGEGCLSFGCHTAFGNTEKNNGQIYNLHTKHLQRISQCVNCHYTKIASFGLTGQNEFSDHSDLVLRPSATLTFGSASPAGTPNTCAISCHRNGYGDRNRPDAFLNVLEGETVRAPDFGVVDSNLMLWNEPSDLELADSLWEGFKRLYPQLSSVRTSSAVSASEAIITTLAPNPARDRVSIEFTLPKPGNIRLSVYDLSGRIVAIIAEGDHESGTYSDTWNCADELHRRVPPGIYVIRLSGEGFSSAKQLAVVR